MSQRFVLTMNHFHPGVNDGGRWSPLGGIRGGYGRSVLIWGNPLFGFGDIRWPVTPLAAPCVTRIAGGILLACLLAFGIFGAWRKRRTREHRTPQGRLIVQGSLVAHHAVGDLRGSRAVFVARISSLIVIAISEVVRVRFWMSVKAVSDLLAEQMSGQGRPDIRAGCQVPLVAPDRDPGFQGTVRGTWKKLS